MKRIDRIQAFCNDKTQDITKEMIISGIDVGISAAEIAEELKLLRNNVSSDLNKLVQKDVLLKIKGRPTRFVSKQGLTSILGVKYIGEKDCTSLTELIEKKRFNTHSSPFEKLIGSKKSLAPVIRLAEAAISYPPHGLHTIILGESGTGKSLLAETMFEYGISEGIFPSNSKFVILNCADYAANPQLLLSQLFGSIKGAYTGADTDHTGLIEESNDGVLFLDEIHRLPSEGQEMLFHYIDKNSFYKLGDSKNKHYSQTLLVCATTENPHSTLLNTFRRRIPVSIQMPNLHERSMSERLTLIEYLYQREATKINTSVTVSASAIKPLLIYFPEGNIGQLKSDIQLSIARGLLEKKKNDYSDVLVTKEFFSPTVTKSLINITANQNKELSILIGHKDLTFNNKRLSNESTDFDYDFLTFFEKNNLTNTSIDKIFNDYTQEISKQSIKDENFTFFLNDDIKNIVLTISDILYEELGIIIEKNITIALSLYIYSHTEERAPVLYNAGVSVTPVSEEISKTVRKIIKQLESTKHFYFHESDIEFLATIISSFKHKKKKKEIAIFLCAHGDNVASEISHTVNDLLGSTSIHPINMGLGISPLQVYETLRLQLQSCEEKNIILFIDMGSLTSLEANLKKDTGKNIIVIESIDTLMLLETAQSIESLSMDLNTCIERIQQISKQRYDSLTRKIETHFEINRKKIIYTVCSTAEGSAQFLKHNLKKVFQKMNIYDIDVKAIRGDSAHSLLEKMKAESDLQIIAIVGTINPNITYIPFISLQEIVLHNGLNKILHFAGITAPNTDDHNIINFNRDVIIDMGIESIDKYLYLLSASKMKKSMNFFIERLEEEFNTIFENDIILKLFIHTACMIERIMLEGSEIVIPEDKKNNLDNVIKIKNALSEIEKEYNILISLDECFFIYEIVNS